jgi:hypothetical protein
MARMPRSPRVLALPLGFLLAAAIAACGGGSHDSAATLTQPPVDPASTAPATTAPPATTTTQARTAPPATTTTATTRTTTRPSGGAAAPAQTGGAPAGCPSAVGGFIRDVRATDCGVAGAVANAWFAAVHGGARPDSTIQADGYSCNATMAGERANVSCTAAGGSVAFTASP